MDALIHDPTAVHWDLQGRLWVVEMTGFVRDLVTPEPNVDPIGNVVVLEDTDNDGRMDKRTVFADKLILPRAAKVLDTGVLVGEPGTLWFMRDTNGDLKADTREVITHSYGLRNGSVEGNANSLFWGLVGSTLALAAPQIPARLLLNGKRPVGLMPPVGSALNDDQSPAFSPTFAVSRARPAPPLIRGKSSQCARRPRRAPGRGPMTS